MAEAPSEKIQKRLPPSQTYTEKWPVWHEGKPLSFAPQTWKLKVHGLVERPLEASWEEFLGWPTTTGLPQRRRPLYRRAPDVKTQAISQL